MIRRYMKLDGNIKNTVLPVTQIATNGDQGSDILIVQGMYANVNASLYVKPDQFELIYKSDESLNPILVLGTSTAYNRLYMWMDGINGKSASFIYRVTWKRGQFIIGLYTGGDNYIPAYNKAGFWATSQQPIILYDPTLYN